MTFRTERDPLGELKCPGRRVLRRPDRARRRELSHQRPPRARRSRHRHDPDQESRRRSQPRLGRLDADVAGAIVTAADEILAGRLRDQFVVDVYQAGAGTSHNMNANEVLANRAGEISASRAAPTTRVHPNDHVNMGQSTNDVFPTATRLALLLGHGRSSTQRAALADGARRERPTSSRRILKTGRTHLQDAVPITLGQEFGGYAACIAARRRRRRRGVASSCTELNLGATAVGTGLNAGDDYRQRGRRVSAALHRPGPEPADNLFRVTQSMGDVLAYSGAMRRLAVELGKIASDLRLLSMGPRAGPVGDRAAGRAAGLVDHAGQGEPVDSRDGQPGLLPGDGLRHDGGAGAARPVSSS